MSEITKYNNGQYQNINDTFDNEEEYKNDHDDIDLDAYNTSTNGDANSVISFESQPSLSQIGSQDTMMRIADIEMEMKCDNPDNWNWKQIQHWLNKRGLDKMKPIFQNNPDTTCQGIDGRTLLNINIAELMVQPQEKKDKNKWMDLMHLNHLILYFY